MIAFSLKKSLLFTAFCCCSLSVVPVIANETLDNEELFVAKAPSPASIFLITNYGATPNSTADAVPAIQRALAAAQNYVKSTGRRAVVRIPRGTFYFSQCVLDNLDNITIHLNRQAVLQAFNKSSSINADNPYITFQNGDNFILSGDPASTIDGAGSSWWSSSGNRPYFISINGCSNYQIYGLAINNSPFHTLCLFDSTNGVIHDLTITSPATSPNTDGIDPKSGIDGLEIYNCTINNGDDAVAIVSQLNPMNNKGDKLKIQVINGSHI